MSETTEWYAHVEECDLCTRPATWAHRDGGRRCDGCPKPRSVGGMDPNKKPRRLIGWRVRWEWFDQIDRKWKATLTSLTNLLDAKTIASRCRAIGPDRTRNVRVMRVYRRRTR